MEATFDVLAPDGSLLGEPALAAGFDDLRPALAEVESDEGLLTIDNPDGRELLVFRDVLGPMIANFCFRAVRELAAGRDVELPFIASDERVTLKRDGDDVVISGGTVAGEERCPARPALEALVSCGERFAALLRRLHGGDPAWAERLAYWDTDAARARASLK